MWINVNGSPSNAVRENPMRRRDFTSDMIAVIKHALNLGYIQHIIAGYYKTNQGRISEIKNGKWGVEHAPAGRLPPDFPSLA